MKLVAGSNFNLRNAQNGNLNVIMSSLPDGLYDVLCILKSDGHSIFLSTLVAVQYNE